MMTIVSLLLSEAIKGLNACSQWLHQRKLSACAQCMPYRTRSTAVLPEAQKKHTTSK